MITIKPAQSIDQNAIAQLHATSWQAVYAGLLDEQYLSKGVFSERGTIWQHRFSQPSANQRIFVASEQKKLLGFICIYLDQSDAQGTLIENLHVDTGTKGKGVGKALLQHAARVIQAEASHNGAYLEVLSQNVSAQRFYDYFGGNPVLSQQWQAPEGSLVDELVYQWEQIATILER
ncbi:putative acetyltransferase [Photobacterium gaetbulicola Gung47]|uniref:Putative acetyltransferase n=1 Tax=Photobacterium gaetbulicola Gung47 TaxID=658445 RepID=A0A0C5WM60_9GAMM|nr:MULTISPECIES: GNAT family N-acetyltransferase [Photobacterium]AJR06164.1 putative acetyltransferase [Photobacterium gaetbulicola Gung47]WEM45413.1 GNAT family N-acetyltransferase [Photobacterium sp. DA100]